VADVLNVVTGSVNNATDTSNARLFHESYRHTGFKTAECVILQGDHKVGEKSLKFSRLFPDPETILFRRLLQQKVNVIITLIRQGSFHINSSNITGHQRTVTIYDIHKILFI